MVESPSVGCVIPTFRARKHLHKCLYNILRSPLKPRILVIDSSSDDGTVEMALALGAEVLTIPQTEFNHGKTREAGRRHLQTDIVCMLTQDAYLAHEDALALLIQPIVQKHAAAAYGRQVPHANAAFLEAFPREFNYPSESHIRSFEDRSKYGVYTFFCSDSCAAYCNKALDAIGGFDKVLLGEDTVAVAKLLRKGYRVAYVAEAVVRHSHSYTLMEEFRRNFDTGLARSEYAALLEGPGGDHRRGLDYVQQMFKQLAQKQPKLIPYACLQVGMKYLGYAIGKRSRRAPLWFKKSLSSQKYYFLA